MTHRLIALPVFALAAAAALPAAAQAVKPGLWEVNNVVGTDNPEIDQAIAAAQKHIAGMPAEQRKRMEEMLSKQGVKVSADGMVSRMCVTKEMAAQNEVPMQQHGDCTQQRSALTGNSMKVSFTCTRPPASGDGVVTFAGDSAYNVKMKVATSVRGKPETMRVDISGKWLGADCGNIQPPQ